MKKNKEIFVTKPFLPPIDEFQKRLPEIWNSRILSNRGPLVRELEAKLCVYLGVKNISLVNNATIGLMVALKALDISGDVITPTFSFSATAHSILWNNLNPVFVDIENNYYPQRMIPSRLKPKPYRSNPKNLMKDLMERNKQITSHK